MLKQTFTGLILGLIITIFAAQRSEWVHHQLEQVIRDFFEESMHCDVTCKVARLNFFIPTLELVDLRVNEVTDLSLNQLGTNGEEVRSNIVEKNKVKNRAQVPVRPESIEGHQFWSWSAKKYLTGFSWLDLAIHKKLNLWVEMHDLHATSSMHGSDIAIVPHIQALLDEVAIDIPTSIKSLSIKHGTIDLHDADQRRTILLHMHGQMQSVSDEQKLHISCISGQCAQRDTVYFDALSGSLNCTLRDNDLAQLSTDLNARVPQFDAQAPIFCVGSWHNKSGSWHIYDAEHRIDGQFGIDDALNIDGEVQLNKLVYKNYPYALNGSIMVHKREALWTGEIAANVNQEAQFAGSWRYDHEQDSGQAHCTNMTPLSLANIPYWRLLANSINLDVRREPGKFLVSYAGIATHDLLAATNSLQGMLEITDGKATVQGNYNDQKYRAAFGIQEFPYLIDAQLDDAQGDPQVKCAHHTDESMQCHLEFSFVRNLIKRLYGYDVQGQGALELQLNRAQNGWQGTIHLAEGTIRLPETYNFINGLEAKFDYDEDAHWLAVHNLTCTMHSGRIECANGALQFDDQWKPTFIHAPVLFEQCMLNFKKDLFALVSGSLTLSKVDGTAPVLAGHLFIERAQLKENLLSQEFQKQLGAYSSNMVASHAPDMECDLTIETMHPIRIDTNILKTNAAVHLAIKNNLNDVEVGGTVRLIGGTLEFPYKPLNIIEGTMYVRPDNLYDPLIELRAKNTIKNHTVSLQVTGSIASHHIMFDATPPLSEEQIIALLLVGSHEESLATMAPALLMQNLKHALFGINEPTVFEKYMHKIAKPLNIHLVPSFTDQTGRGGLRGALEIDVNDRWRAMIQKNFTLTEDTRFELDYLLSDDITIRAIRDERRDVGGEVEIKWKM